MKINIMKCDVLSDSGYFYPKDVMQKAIDDFNAKYNEKNPCLCDNDSTTTIDTDIAKVSHSIHNMEMDEEGIVHGNFIILKTPYGEILQSVIDSGVEMKGYSRGIATVDTLDDVNTISDYKYIGVQLNVNEEIKSDISK